MNNAENIARHLGLARKAGNGWSCKCPCHDDRKASLSITEVNNKVLLKCHAGCDQGLLFQTVRDMGLLPKLERVERPKLELVDISGLKNKSPTTVSDKPLTAEKTTEKRIIAQYDYTDERGEVLFSAIRYEPKDFRQKAASGAWSLSGVRKVLFRLPEVIEAVKQNKTIYIVEGEKDVLTAEKLGLVATCNPMGACKWIQDYSESLRGANVVIIPDLDHLEKPDNYAGFKHHNQVLRSLKDIASNISTIILPMGKDLTEFVEAGGDFGSLSAVEARELEEAKLMESEPTISLSDDVADIVNDLKPIQWLVEGVFEDKSLCQIFGSPGAGKSFFAVSIASSVATGVDWFGHKVKKGSVFYIAGEGHNGMARRFAAWSKENGVGFKGCGLRKTKKPVSILDIQDVNGLLKHVDEISQTYGDVPSLIIVDTLARSFAGGDENSNEDMGLYIRRIDEIKARYNCSVLLIHHTGHNSKERARGSSSLFGALDCEWMVERDESGLVLFKNTKMKDAPMVEDPITFRLAGVSLGEVEDQEITSAVVRLETQTLNVEVGKTASGNPIKALEVVRELRSGSSISQATDNLMTTKRKMKEIVEKMIALKLIHKEDPNVQKSSYKLTELAESLFSQTGGLLPSAQQKQISQAPWRNPDNND